MLSADALPRLDRSDLFHHVRRWEPVAAIQAIWLRGARLLPAVRTIDHLSANLPINNAVPGVDLKDLGLKVIVGKSQVIAEQFPHCLAGQRELFKFLLGIVLPGDQSIDFVRCDFSSRSGLIYLEVL